MSSSLDPAPSPPLPSFQITEESPLGEDLALLFARHTADMHADTPPESIHMMDRGQLAAPGIRFFVLRDQKGRLRWVHTSAFRTIMQRSSRCMS